MNRKQFRFPFPDNLISSAQVSLVDKISCIGNTVQNGGQNLHNQYILR